MWLAGRIGVPNPEDISPRTWPSEAVPPNASRSVSARRKAAHAQEVGRRPNREVSEGVDFFVRLDQVLSENPLPEDAPVVDTFRSIGIVPAGCRNSPKIRRRPWLLLTRMRSTWCFDAAKNTGTPVNGWNWGVQGRARYGTDYLLRAAVNMNSVGLNSPERALYPKRYVDSKGQRLHGKHAYTLTMPAAVPVRTENGGLLVRHDVRR